MTDQYLSHSFDPQVAAVYGINAALIFQYICWRSDHSDDRWVTLTIDSICKQYPYLGRDQCWRALHRLICPSRKTPALVHRKPTPNKLAFLYAPACKDHASDRMHSFNVQVAEQVGVVAAIIYQNISYWIKENWKNTAEKAYGWLDPDKFDMNDDRMQAFAWEHTREAAAHHTRIEDWLKLHPYISYCSATRGFLCLQQQGMLAKTYADSRIPVWRMPLKAMRIFEVKFLKNLDLLNSTIKTKRHGSKPNGSDQNQTPKIRTKQESGLSDSAESTYEALESSLSEASVIRSANLKPFEENIDDFDQPALADARSGQTEGRRSRASRQPPVERETLQKIKSLNKHTVSAIREKTADHPVRPYHRKPQPQNPDDLNIMDDLSFEEWQKHIRSGS